MSQPNGVILYEGPSEIDGAPIVAIATGLASSSNNTKTGGMIQSWIMRSDIPPHDAQKSGLDSSVCGSCVKRPALAGDADPLCYVKVFQAPLSVWKAYKRGNYRPAPLTAFVNRDVRLGSYGDPGAVPGEVWSRYLLGVDSWTGYTQRWRDGLDVASVLMASVDTAEEAIEAQDRGFRTFRTMLHGESLLPGEILCPASKEAGYRTTCEQCGLCDGKQDPGDRRKSIAIFDHSQRRASLRVIQ